LALLFGLGQGVAALMVAPEYIGISGAIMIASVVIVLAGSARIAGVNVTLRLGGWTAAYGMLFSLGLASLLFMMPTVFGYFVGGEPTAMVGVARGFGLYAIEALGLILLGPALLLLPRMGERPRRTLGVAVLLGAAGLAAFRLASL
jgi:hypothetical protein